MGSIITAKNIEKNFMVGRRKIEALKNVNISIEEGKLTILKGRSGSGKTTLMNMIGALDKPSNGQIHLDTVELTALSEAKRDKVRRTKIGIIFQSVALISTMSAYENVEFGLKIAGYDRRAMESRIKECFKLVGLEKRMYHRPNELSGGEQQRVAIARAISHKPRIILADEPTAELDTMIAMQIVKLFKQLVEEEGVTVLMTTHDPGMVDIADVVYTLEDGEIVDGI